MGSPATKEHSTSIQAKGNTVKLIGEFMPMDAGDMEMCATDQDGVFALRDMDDMPESVEVDGMTMPPPAGMMFATADELRDMAESIMTGPASKMMGSLQAWGKPGPYSALRFCGATEYTMARLPSLASLARSPFAREGLNGSVSRDRGGNGSRQPLSKEGSHGSGAWLQRAGAPDDALSLSDPKRSREPLALRTEQTLEQRIQMNKVCGGSGL